MNRLRVFVACDLRRFGVSVVPVAGGKALAVWHGYFGKYDKAADGTLFGAQKAVMSKAVWLGRKVAEGMGEGIRLEVVADGVPDALVRQQAAVARRYHVELVMKREAGENPAVRLVREVTDFQRPDLGLAARCVEVVWIGSDR